jgi:hypothetical protein
MKYQVNMKQKKRNKQDLLILAIILILLGIGVGTWKYSSNLEEFGLNFFTEMLGVLVTVLIVDKVIQYREKNRMIPQKISVYNDVRLFVSRYMSFWIDCYRLSVPEKKPETVEDFFSEKGMPKIWDCLDLDSKANVTPPQTWWTWIPQNAKEFKESGDKILDRHAHILEPEVYSHVHKITESGLLKTLQMIPFIKQSDSIEKIPRHTILGAYSIRPSQEDFTSIIYLYNWCNLQFKDFQQIEPDLHKVSEYTKEKDKKIPPSSCIPEEKLKQQIVAFEKFQNRNK